MQPSSALAVTLGSTLPGRPAPTYPLPFGWLQPDSGRPAVGTDFLKLSMFFPDA